jgi:membrane fusion protein (multidrug efflux system)
MRQGTKKNKARVFIPLGLVIIAVLTGAGFWYRDYSSFISTDDAHVDADNLTVSSKILGRITYIYADEGDRVEKGMLLAVLDSSDLVAQKNQAVAMKEQAFASVIQSGTKLQSDQESLKVIEINYERAKDDFERASKQLEGGVITQEQYDHARKACEAAAAQVEASKALLAVSRAQVKSASAATVTSDAQIKVIETQLRNVKLYSPSDGVISRRWLLPGDVIQPSQSVFTITDDKDKWVSAYLEETKIANIHDGQKVRIIIDAFPHVKFYGKVYLVGSSTASVFSLIPANNASGNFTKVTQRIPIRISIDSADNGRDISSFNILSGMSALVKISRK